ncbi:hypothetical protein [Rhizobium leguminosarum]|uniref:hypothetical protein n=1 Tax=Rhizobium leguminosarum TaxID=384 RepID=UPI00102F7B72|nr:hypothetical protein [Rhizobium leguminosarum]TAU72755.1 hypothetical protein ELI40_32450 [Rhizobium leguminosarum]TAV84731.1 hypothetical protein ELI22_24520 [Rhizobium leguminosarum]TAV85999.1 hypothetical protein ELI21_25210 [Rhizobium leguminosarum]TAW27761.1 hypothetical protein ELI23_26610 [Rhizobium leguminosarum]TAX05636.1 hypothetical protein ELI07_25600 [Rhizobium leguminosarum]
MSARRLTEDPLFECGPPRALQFRLGVLGNGQLHVLRRASLVVTIGWMPLIILASVQSLTSQTGALSSVLLATGAHGRYLIAAPLLIFAEAECALRLNAIVRQFDAGLIPARNKSRYEAAVASTRRLLNSGAVEIFVIALAYILSATAALSQPFEQVPIWHKTGGIAPTFSPAGWWHVLISLPLLLTLLLGWAWRLILWARLLWLIAGLDLRLMASHPDRAAGLGFVGYSVRAFYIVALALASIVAGAAAHVVLLGDPLTRQYLILSATLLLCALALFSAPLLILSPSLMSAWRRGALQYGALADRVGTAFENKWLTNENHVEITALDQQDFSATTDLYSVVANVYALRLVPIDLKSVVILLGAMLLPFIPVVFLALPGDQILAGLKQMIF